jgi:hypothetical protein
MGLTGGKAARWLMVKDEDLKFMDKAGTLAPALNRLIRTGYVKDDEKAWLGFGLGLTGKGVIAIEMLFRNFLIYMRKSNFDELGTWINTLELSKNNSLKLTRDSLHFIEYEPPVGKAFDNYLNDLGTLENLRHLEVEQPQQDRGELIDDIFQHIGEINTLFEHKLGRRLFCTPPEVYPKLSKAVRGRNVNYTDFVASVALLIDRVCHKEIGGLVGLGNNHSGSIDTIESILKHNKIDYKPNIIITLRIIRGVRNTTFPLYDTGSDEVVQLKKLGIKFPIENPRDAAYTVLQSLNSCLVEMKNWFS